MGYGLPIAMAGSGIGFFLSLPTAQTLFWTPAGFLIAAALAIAAGLAVREDGALARLYRIALGTSLIALPVLRMALGGADWGQLAASGNTAVVAFDLVLLLAGTGFVLAATGLRLGAAKAPRTADRVAAE